jgi:hypothetical protein
VFALWSGCAVRAMAPSMSGSLVGALLTERRTWLVGLQSGSCLRLVKPGLFDIVKHV